MCVCMCICCQVICLELEHKQKYVLDVAKRMRMEKMKEPRCHGAEQYGCNLALIVGKTVVY